MDPAGRKYQVVKREESVYYIEYQDTNQNTWHLLFGKHHTHNTLDEARAVIKGRNDPEPEKEVVWP